VKIEPGAAMPVAMLTWRNVELTPDARPGLVRRDDADRRRGQRRVDHAAAEAGHDETGD
jgi:hypothetical protein